MKQSRFFALGSNNLNNNFHNSTNSPTNSAFSSSLSRKLFLLGKKRREYLINKLRTQENSPTSNSEAESSSDESEQDEIINEKETHQKSSSCVPEHHFDAKSLIQTLKQNNLLFFIKDSKDFDRIDINCSESSIHNNYGNNIGVFIERKRKPLKTEANSSQLALVEKRAVFISEFDINQLIKIFEDKCKVDDSTPKDAQILQSSSSSESEKSPFVFDPSPSCSSNDSNMMMDDSSPTASSSSPDQTQSSVIIEEL